MRPKAGQRPVLTSSVGDADRAGRDHVATVRRGEATVARLWWQHADEDDLTGWIAAELPQWQTAVLEHRRAPVDDVRAPAHHDDPDGPADADQDDGVRLRLRTVDDHQVLARASAHCCDGVERWRLQLPEGHVWDLSVPLRRRPTTLAVHEAGELTSWRIESCRRPAGWALTGPPQLGAASTVMCLWLAHLLDVAHVLHDRPWWAPPEWTVLADTTGRLAPGGFTAIHTGSGGGGSAPVGSF